MMSIQETKDYKLISELNEEVQNLHAKLHPDLFKPFDKQSAEKAFETLCADSTCTSFVALKNNVAIGYMVCCIREIKENAFQYGIKTVYIDQVGVLKTYQKTGAGKLLLEQAEKLAKEKAIGRIELEHWSSNNLAGNYFRKNGYTLYKERLFKLVV